MCVWDALGFHDAAVRDRLTHTHTHTHTHSGLATTTMGGQNLRHRVGCGEVVAGARACLGHNNLDFDLHVLARDKYSNLTILRCHKCTHPQIHTQIHTHTTTQTTTRAHTHTTTQPRTCTHNREVCVHACTILFSFFRTHTHTSMSTHIGAYARARVRTLTHTHTHYPQLGRSSSHSGHEARVLGGVCV